MKRTLLMSMLIALNSSTITSNDRTYIENANAANIDVIKTDSACAGQSCGCSGELETTRFVSLTAMSYENCKQDKEESSNNNIVRNHYTGKADYSKIGAIKQ